MVHPTATCHHVQPDHLIDGHRVDAPAGELPDAASELGLTYLFDELLHSGLHPRLDVRQHGRHLRAKHTRRVRAGPALLAPPTPRWARWAGP